MSHWIECKEALPDENTWVLGVINSIHLGSDLPKCAIVKIRKGITSEERAALKSVGDPRAKEFRFGDEANNNLTNYAWRTSGILSYFGQEIIRWQPLPEIDD